MPGFNRELVYSHLARYKRDSLGVTESGTWRGRPYPHILPERDGQTMNLIDKGYRPWTLENICGTGVKLHKGFHHLNSSQAVAFNLFAPLVKENRLETVLHLIGSGDKIEEARFEHVEDEQEGTNFDFFIRGQKRNLYFEVKYTESSFGTAKMDARHNRKYEEIYRCRLEQICSIGKEEFFKKYQLWRNVCYSSTGFVVFVFPRFRMDLEREILEAKKKAFSPEDIKIMYIDDLVAENLSSDRQRLNAHFGEFKRKYLRIEGM